MKDDALLLLEAQSQAEQDDMKRDAELIRIGGNFVRLIQSSGWPILVQKIEELRNALAQRALSNEPQDLQFIRGQADGAQKVLELVQNGIQAAQEALGRYQEAREVSGAKREVFEGSEGLVGD